MSLQQMGLRRKSSKESPSSPKAAHFSNANAVYLPLSFFLAPLVPFLALALLPAITEHCEPGTL